MPNLYTVEGSDHPGRICTQAFSVRQIFDKHVLDIRLEKSRNANNQKPVLSYSWDVNTGNAQFIPSTEAVGTVPGTPTVSIPGIVSKHVQDDDIITDDSFEEEVEF